MFFYLLLTVTFSLDMISFIKNKNSKDKIPYIIAMVIIAILGIFFLRYGDELRISDRVLQIMNLDGGI